MVKWIGSPNFWQGRYGHKVDRIVMHWMDGTLAGTDQVFQDKARQTSAHYGIEDKNVHQYVRDTDTAWHSGDGDMNSRSIGIEHSAAPNRPASAQTIATSAALLADLSKRYNIPLDRKHVLKHSEVTPTQCPGTLPIDEILKQANALLKGDTVKVDLFTARRLAYAILGDKTALTGARDADLKKNHVGKELNTAYIEFLFNSKEAAAKRAEADKLVKPGEAEKKLEAAKAAVDGLRAALGLK